MRDLFTYSLKYLLELVFTAVFVGSDNRARHVPILLNILVSIEIVYLVAQRDLLLKLLGIVSLASLFLMRYRYIVARPVFILALVPSLWYVSLALLFRQGLYDVLDVFTRVFVISSTGLILAQTLNPIEVSWLLSILKRGSRWPLYPALLWKITPHVLRDLGSSVTISRLKEEVLWKSIAASILVFDEYTDFYEEGLLSREKVYFTYYYDKRETLKTLVLLIIVVALHIYLIT